MSAAVEQSFPADYEVRVREEVASWGGQQQVFSATSADAAHQMMVEVATEGMSWLGLFEAGGDTVRGALSGVFTTPHSKHVCVVARGIAYLVDTVRPNLFEVLQTGGPVVSVRPVVEERLLLLASPWTITAVGEPGPRWQTRRLSVERLRLDEVADGKLAGVADPDDDEARNFVVDLRTGEHEGGTPFS